MEWYIGIFIYCLIIYILHTTIKDVKIKQFLEILTLIVLILFSGTRYRLGGYDYEIYENMFNQTSKLWEYKFSILNLYGSDIIYSVLNSIVKTLGFSFYGFTLIESIIFHVLLYKGIKKYNINFGFFIIVFLYKLFIFNTFVSMRQSLVLVIFFNSIQYLIDDKKIKYIITILVCSLLHTSSLILLPLVFINKLNISRKIFIIYCSVFGALFIINVLGIYEFNPNNIISAVFSNNNIILGKADRYFSTQTKINILSTLEVYLIAIIYIIFYNKLYKDVTKEQRVIINLFFIIIPIVTFLRSVEVMIRIRDYFSLFMPFVLYYICNILKNKEKMIVVFIICILCFVGYYRYIYTYGGLTPYKSYITENISIISEE